MNVPRPHIEFIQQQSLPWRSGIVPVDGVVTRILSRDEASGAVTMINRYPADTAIEQAYALDIDKEFIVLRGELRINEVSYTKGDYAYMPAGFERRKTIVPEACDVLTFYEGSTDLPPGELVERIRTNEVEWGEASDPNVASASIHRHVLRPDTAIGERTWLLRLDTDEPYEIRGVERHPCVEEMYLLDGDIHMVTGVMTAGAYFWRPALVPHGPTGSKSGFTALFRAIEGAFETEWSDLAESVPWDAPYDPVLPSTESS